jgi:hypothetical protein
VERTLDVLISLQQILDTEKLNSRIRASTLAILLMTKKGQRSSVFQIRALFIVDTK